MSCEVTQTGRNEVKLLWAITEKDLETLINNTIRIRELDGWSFENIIALHGGWGPTVNITPMTVALIFWKPDEVKPGD